MKRRPYFVHDLHIELRMHELVDHRIDVDDVDVDADAAIATVKCERAVVIDLHLDF